MNLIEGAIQFDGSTSGIKLAQYFNLYPDVNVYIDKTTAVQSGKDYTRLYSETYDVSDCCTDVKIKTVLRNNCGQLTCKLISKDCQSKFNVGDRIRLYLDKRCWFCGFIFTTDYKSSTSMNVIAFDFLRYFKAPLTYGKNQLIDDSTKQGLTASGIFRKICQDLSIPFDVYTNPPIPITPQNYTQKTAFNILDFAITETLINSPKNDRQYYTYFHETCFEDDYKKDMGDQEVYKTSGKVIFCRRNNLTVDTLIDDSMVYNYSFKESIDQQTYNEIIVYKDQKTYLSKTGKTLKKGKKTGTQIKKVSRSNLSKALFGYLPYYHRAPDGYSEGQMQQIADGLLNVFNRPTHSLSTSCYGIIGMRAGYLVPIALSDIGGTSIGVSKKDEKTGETYTVPVYRTITECEMCIEYPLKMNLKISSGTFEEVDI